MYTSPFLDTDDLKMALRARKLSGAFEKRAPDLQMCASDSHVAGGPKEGIRSAQFSLLCQYMLFILIDSV